MLTAAGWLLHAAIARFTRNRLHVSTKQRLAVTGALGALLLTALGAYARGSDTPPDLSELRQAPRPPLYFLGTSFEGVQLRHAEARDRFASFVYGDCELPVSIDPGGCAPPLEIQNVACDSRTTAVAIFGHDRRQMRRAAEALRLVNRPRPLPRRPPKVHLDANPFARCLATS